MLSDNKVIEIFYMADDFCKFFIETVKKHSIEDGKKQLTLFQSLTNSPVRTAELCRAYSALIGFASF